MFRRKSRFRIHRSINEAGMAAKKVHFKADIDAIDSADKTKDSASVAKFDSFDILPEAGKIIITKSDSSKVIVDDIKNYPLGRSQAHLVKEIAIAFENDGTITNMSAAVDIATALANRLTEASGKIVIVVVKDEAFHSSTKTVLPTIFQTSNYVANVEHVVVGNATAGEAMMPAEYAAMTLDECGKTGSTPQPQPQPQPQPDPDPQPDPEPEEEEGDGAVF